VAESKHRVSIPAESHHYDPRGRPVTNFRPLLLRTKPTIGRLARRALPSPLVEAAQRLATPLSSWESEYVPEGWARASDSAITGWNVEAVRDAYLAKWPTFVRAVEGSGPLGIHHVVTAGNPVKDDDLAAHNRVIVFGYVLALAARQTHRISVLDWGGALGHYYLISKALLPEVEISYHCKEVPLLCECGRGLLPDVRFHQDEACLDRTYDLVLASGSLQYSEGWRETLGRLASAAGRYLFVTRLPVVLSGPSFVVVERAYAYGYEAEYLGWVLDRDELLDRASESGMALLREFVISEGFSVRKAPEQVELRGFLFQPQIAQNGDR
jgi:putative methyltransferase (TIGR04325 family)